MPQLDEDAALALAGGDVTDLATAEAVETVTPEHVQAAERAADAAEAKAQQSEAAAVLGNLAPAAAAADREAARYSRLRARVTARRAERHRQAERLRGLAQCGTDALKHAEGLAELRDATVADLAAIDALHAGIAGRITAWNDGLSAIVERISDLGPEPLLPGGVPRPSSAGVWGATVDTRPRVNTGGHVITGVNVEHAEGLVAAIDAASQEMGARDPSMRLIIGANGVVQPLGRDPGGHLQRQINEGKLHELDLGEKKRYLAGEQVSHHA